jgi:predicted nucleic acid-binding protein
MKAFIDTSTLFKRYVVEVGTDDLERLLEDIDEVIISPTCVLELHGTLARCLRQARITVQERKCIAREFETDRDFFHTVIWNQALEEQAIRIIKKHALKTLDAIQLAAAESAGADLFITSDKQLYTISRAVLSNPVLL